MGVLALRDVFEECAHPCMRRHPIVVSPKLGVASGMVTSSHRREWPSIEMRTSLPAYPAGDRGFESRSLQRGVCEPSVPQRRSGTEGSNPLPSSGESGANLDEHDDKAGDHKRAEVGLSS